MGAHLLSISRLLHIECGLLPDDSSCPGTVYVVYDILCRRGSKTVNASWVTRTRILCVRVLFRPRYLRLSYKRLRGFGEKGLKAEKEIAMMYLAR